MWRADLYSATEQEQNGLLQGLGESITGTSDAKDMRLRLAIGIEQCGCTGGKTFVFGRNG